MKKTIGLIVVLTMMVTAFSALSVSAANRGGKVTDPRLLSSVTNYSYDKESGEWYKVMNKTYSYKKSYPTKIKTNYYYEEGNSETEKISYKFKKNKPVKMKYKRGQDYTKGVYKNGKRIKSVYRTLIGSDQVEKYKRNKKGFITKAETTNYEKTGKKKLYHGRMSKYSVASKNGLLKKVVEKNYYGDWEQGKKKKYNFSYKTVSKYNNSGILTQIGSDQYKYECVIENGRVKEVIVRMYDEYAKSKWSLWEKHVFSYNDTKIDKGRYAMMINDIISEGNYKYFWY